MAHALVAVDVTDIDVQEVDQTAADDATGDLQSLVGPETGAAPLVHSHAYAQDIVVADTPTNFLQDFHRKAQPVVQAAAIFVVARVAVRGPEGIH